MFEANDPGVMTSDDGSSTQHVNNDKKAHVVLLQMKRTVTYCDSRVFISLNRGLQTCKQRQRTDKNDYFKFILSKLQRLPVGTREMS